MSYYKDYDKVTGAGVRSIPMLPDPTNTTSKTIQIQMPTRPQQSFGGLVIGERIKDAMTPQFESNPLGNWMNGQANALKTWMQPYRDMTDIKRMTYDMAVPQRALVQTRENPYLNTVANPATPGTLGYTGPQYVNTGTGGK